MAESQTRWQCLNIKAKREEKQRLGWYDDNDGSVHIIVGNLNTIEDAARVILHEVVGHKGVKIVLGDSYGAFMKEIYNNISDKEKQKVIDRGYKAKNHQKIAEEWVAMRSEKEPNPSWLKRMYAKMRGFLRKYFGSNVSNAELDVAMHRLFKRSRRAVRNNPDPDGNTPRGLFKLMNHTDTKGSTFQQWFGDSKVVDSKGDALIVYHGTRKEFDTFGTKKTSMSNKHRMWYFTNDKEMANTHAGFSKGITDTESYGSNVMPVYLSINNPKILKMSEIDVIEDLGYWATDEQLDGFLSQGYDGLMLEDKSQIIALNPNQVKSAIGNDGNYSKTDDNINHLFGRKKKDKPYKSPELVEAYEEFKDKWIGEKDLKTINALTQADGFQKRMQEIYKKSKPEGASSWREMSEAAHLYADLLRFPEKLNDEAEKIEKLSAEKKRLIKLSQNLPSEVIDIVTEIVEEYKALGEYALENGVIGNLLDSYVARFWEIENNNSSEFWRRFGITTKHRKQRKLDTIIDGWTSETEEGEAMPMELKVKGLANNLAQVKQEIHKSLENKNFIERGMAFRDADGSRLFTTSSPKDGGYAKINHPSFTQWAWAGQLKEDVSEPQLEDFKGDIESFDMAYELWVENALQEYPELSLEMFASQDLMVTKDGVILRKKEVYAPEPIAKRINKILDPSAMRKSDFMMDALKTNAILKKTILSFSYFHHMAFGRSYYLSAAFKDVKDLNIDQAYKDGLRMMQDMTPEFKLLVRNGLTIGRNQDWDEALIKEKGRISEMLDKWGVSVPIRKKVTSLYDSHTKKLFGELGAGLKLKAAALELRKHKMNSPDVDINTLAAEVAKSVNADYGGLHTERMERGATTQHALSLMFLAKDWTESNLLTVVRAFGFDYTMPEGKKIIPARERQLYHHLWKRMTLEFL